MVLRKLPLIFTLISLPATFAGASESVPVSIDQAMIVKIARPAHDIVVGNPAIASITALGPTSFVLTGKSFGRTNIIYMDAEGATITEQKVVVGYEEADRIVVYRGGVGSTAGYSAKSYQCFDRCIEVPQPGDTSYSIQSHISDAEAKAGTATASAATTVSTSASSATAASQPTFTEGGPTPMTQNPK